MVKVKVESDKNKDNPLEYEVKTQMKVAKHLQGLHALTKCEGNWKDYVLQNGTTMQAIETDEAIAKLKEGEFVYVKKKPTDAVSAALKQLSDAGKDKKKIIFDLKTQLADDLFAQEFVLQEGVPLMVKMVDESSGNLLSYAMTALQATLKWSDVEQCLSPEFIGKVVESIDSTNLNVIKSSLEIVNSYVAATHADFNGVGYVIEALKEKAAESKKTLYANLVELLSSADVAVQRNALMLINSVLHHSGDKEAILHSIAGLGMNKALLKLDSELKEFQSALFDYQCHRLEKPQELRRTPFDPTDKGHIAMLTELWTSIFPPGEHEDDSAIEAISSVWKTKLGFSCADPSMDLSVLGILPLHLMHHFAKQETGAMKTIVMTQNKRPERDYPIAQACVQLTQMICDTLALDGSIAGDGGDIPVFTFLLDSDSAVEELFMTSLQVFDRVWEEMNLTTTDFPRIMRIIKKQIADLIFNKPTSFTSFSNMANQLAKRIKHSNMSVRDQYRQMMQEGGCDPRPVVELAAEMTSSMTKVVEQMRLTFCKNGSIFTTLSMGKGKPIRRLCKLEKGERVLEFRWGELPEGAVADAFETSDAVEVEDIQAVLTGKLCQCFQGVKKMPSEEEIELTLELQFKTPYKDENSLNVTAPDRQTFQYWLDALNAATGRPKLSEEAKEEAQKLATLELNVLLMELDGGVDVPSAPPAVPEAPPHFDFVRGL